MPDMKDKYEQLNQVIAELKNQPGALMPVLQKAQGIFGCVPMDVQKIIAEVLQRKCLIKHRSARQPMNWLPLQRPKVSP